MKKQKCSPFEFLAAYKADGLEENTDGILGLSPHKNEDKRKMHYLSSLKDNGIIDKAVVSFSISSSEMGEEPYALFGGVNPTQIVGGMDGLKSFPSFPNFLGTWALEGQSIHYDSKKLDGTERSYPAIMDTGTSQMSIPPAPFSLLQEQWNSVVPGGIDCTSDPSFCTSKKQCAELETVLKPVGIQLSGYAYDINPKEYLFQADGDGGKCFFVINECKLGGKNKDIYIIGDAFLKHFYSAFDFDNN